MGSYTSIYPRASTVQEKSSDSCDSLSTRRAARHASRCYLRHARRCAVCWRRPHGARSRATRRALPRVARPFFLGSRRPLPLGLGRCCRPHRSSTSRSWSRLCLRASDSLVGLCALRQGSMLGSPPLRARVLDARPAVALRSHERSCQPRVCGSLATVLAAAWVRPTLSSLAVSPELSGREHSLMRHSLVRGSISPLRGSPFSSLGGRSRRRWAPSGYRFPAGHSLEWQPATARTK